MSCHLTIGTFNYVVKDPDCIRVSGQFWIKDIGGQSHNLVSSNFMRCIYSGEPGDRLLSKPYRLSASLQCFARLIQSIESAAPCQPRRLPAYAL